MAYIVGTDRYQTRMITTSLDDLISKNNSVRVIDSYIESLDLEIITRFINREDVSWSIHLGL